MRLVLVAFAALAVAACSGSSSVDADGTTEVETGAAGATAEAEPVPEGETLTVGWILAGPADAESVEAVEQAFPDRIQSVVASDATDPAAAASSLTAQGARLVVSAVPGACEAIPDTHCIEPGSEGWWNRAYLIGRGAGLLTETDSIGYVAGGDDPVETAAINAFALGCQSGNPNCVVRLLVAPGNPARALKRLAGWNADLLATTSSDSALCDARAKTIAVQPVLAAGDPCGRAFVSTDLATFAEPFVQSELDGNFERAEAPMPLDTWGDSVPAEARAKVEQRADEIEGGLNVFSGPLFDNAGEQQVAEGEELDEAFIAGRWTWLLGGVLRGGS